MVGGAARRLAAPWGVARLGSQKRRVILTSVLQALAWVPRAVTMYWAVGFAAGPA